MDDDDDDDDDIVENLPASMDDTTNVSAAKMAGVRNKNFVVNHNSNLHTTEINTVIS